MPSKKTYSIQKPIIGIAKRGQSILLFANNGKNYKIIRNNHLEFNLIIVHLQPVKRD